MPRKYPKAPPKAPKYRFHKPSGRAVIQYEPFYGANPHYLPGAFNSPESLAAYEVERKRIMEHKLAGRPAAPDLEPRRNASVNRVLLEFFRWAKRHYGSAKHKTFDHLWRASKPLSSIYGKTRAQDFGPRALAKVREQMVGRGWTRQYVNRQVDRLRSIFKWAVANEYIDSTVLGNLKALDGLRKGYTTAPEATPVRPVDWPDVAAVLPFMTPLLAAMTEIKYLTGMRSDELTGMRLAEMDLRADVWIYEPREHKTAHRGKRKVICLGPRSQALLLPYLPGSLDAFIFSPGVSCWEQSQARAAGRKSKLYGKALNRQPKPRNTRERYDAHSYQTAVNHAFAARAKSLGFVRPDDQKLRPWLRSVGIRFWTPHALRHSRGTLTRAAYGIEGAQASLGNTLEATEIYAEKSLALALKIARETG